MKYMSLDQKGGYMAEYIWIDGSNGVRSKTKVCLYFLKFLLPPTHASSSKLQMWQCSRCELIGELSRYDRFLRIALTTRK